MYNKKSFLKTSFILIFLTATFIAFSSCATTEQKIYTMLHEDGQIIFLRPVSFDDKSFVLRNSNLDITFKIVDFKITDENVVNYTIFLPNGYYNDLNDVELFFKTPANDKITLETPKILYKDFDKKKNLEVRYSTKITGADVKELLAEPEKTQIGLRLKDEIKLFSSEDFSQKLYETGIIINE